MKNFTYYNPTKIVFGTGTERQIGKHIADAGIKKVLLVYGSDRIKKEGLFDTVADSLAAEGVTCVALGGIVSNPLLSKVYEGIEAAKKEGVEAILAVGGGSVLDSAKAIAAGACYEGDVWDFFTFKSAIEKALPVFDVITLAATGSEMNGSAVVTNDATKQKFFISTPLLNPKVSVVNPALQKTVSDAYLVYSASDIIAHSIEGYFTAAHHPDIISAYVEANIVTVVKTTEALLAAPDDDDARGEFACQRLDVVVVLEFVAPPHRYGVDAQIGTGDGPRHGAEGIAVATVEHREQYALDEGMGVTQEAVEREGHGFVHEHAHPEGLRRLPGVGPLRQHL